MQTEPRIKRFPMVSFAFALALPGHSRFESSQSHHWHRKSIRLAAALLAGLLSLTTQTSLATAQDATLQDLFEERCRICHKKLAGIARKKLITVDGRLYGRYTDRDIAEFMTHHGRLNDEEVKLIVEELQLLSEGNLEK